MVKWADYLISAVRYNFEHTQIVDVKRHLDQGDGVARGNIVSRNIIAEDLRNGLKYKTIHRGTDQKWIVDKDLKLDPQTGFITVITKSISKDNLGEILEF